MAILPKSGRAAIAKAIMQRPLHLAWGKGNPAWGDDPPPPEDAMATGLIDEIGRRKVLTVAFVVPDPNGMIDIAGAGTFSESVTATNQIVVRTKFDFADGVGNTIRELGLFMDTVTADGLPAGQLYFTPDEITDPGILIHLEHKLPIIRSMSTREMIDILITF